MKKIRKCKTAALAAALCLCLTGCGSPREGEEASGSATTEPAEKEEGRRSGASEDTASEAEVMSLTPVEITTPVPATPSPEPEDTGFAFTMCFAGDINLDENWGTTQFMDAQPEGISDCISEELVETMRAADIMCLNNEFTYSENGEPLPGKLYTFRALPERVEVLHRLGVDAVTLANNHVYDYGEISLLDTMSVLEEAEIPYFGAGHNLEEAMEPLYLEVEGKTIALVGASRAEKYKMTPQATETDAGILRCYDTELFLQVIEEASANSDFCIAFVHWGTEDTFVLEDVQLETGKDYLDAGADVVIGAHPHRVQGMEFYDGKPIIYSLGNYWFNEETLDTMLLQLHFSGDDEETELTVQVVPALQEGYRTIYVEDAEKQRELYDFLESISINVEISDEGIVTEAAEQAEG